MLGKKLKLRKRHARPVRIKERQKPIRELVVVNPQKRALDRDKKLDELFLIINLFPRYCEI